MKFFFKDFCGTLQVRVVLFGMQVDDDVLYCGIANQPSAAYSSQYLSNFFRGWSGGAMVQEKLPVPGRPTIWIQ